MKRNRDSVNRKRFMVILFKEKRMEDKKILLDKIDTADVEGYCKNKAIDKNCNIYKQGKIWYCEVENIKNQIVIQLLRHILLSRLQLTERI